MGIKQMVSVKAACILVSTPAVCSFVTISASGIILSRVLVFRYMKYISVENNCDKA